MRLEPGCLVVFGGKGAQATGRVLAFEQHARGSGAVHVPVGSLGLFLRDSSAFGRAVLWQGRVVFVVSMDVRSMGGIGASLPAGGLPC